jgi:16S rRNA (guanine(966)-N(2))-methyltransferase RsmD
VRVITGKYKGRRLTPVKGADIRYTADNVKEALFSILQDDIFESSFLDLFAGSGNVGIEALSRGAKSVTFVDINRACIRAITSNLAQFGLSLKPPEITLLNMSMSRSMRYFQRRKAQFHTIFLDPPYRLGLVEKTLKEISTCGILSSEGQLIAEHDIKEESPERLDKLIITRQKRYGTTVLSFYTLADNNLSQ